MIILMLMSDMPNVTVRTIGSLPTVNVCFAAIPFARPRTRYWPGFSLVFSTAPASWKVGVLDGLPFLSSLLMVHETGSVIGLPVAPLVALIVTSGSEAAVAALLVITGAAQKAMANKNVAARVMIRTGHP